MLNKVGFIGFGLIGGSIARKLKTGNPDIKIYATANREETIKRAYSLGLIENDSKIDFEGFFDCDYIFLCAPVEKNIEYLSSLKNIIKPDCIITDVGSTKTAIHEEVIRLGLENNFIGGHPMTGSEKTGIDNSNTYLLENAYYIITPTSKSKDNQIENFKNIVLSLGSIPLILDYKTHDYATASISHLPHMVAFTLVNLIKKLDDNNETMKTIAAGGFKDITRIASSSPIMWENICSSNKEQLLDLMDKYIAEMQALRDDIAISDHNGLLEYFQSAKDYRDSINIINNSRIIYEIYLDLPDETGGIAMIANLLAFKGISIKNIGIINNREFEEGVLRIEFEDNNSLTLASELLKDKNYTIYNR